MPARRTTKELLRKTKNHLKIPARPIMPESPTTPARRRIREIPRKMISLLRIPALLEMPDLLIALRQPTMPDRATTHNHLIKNNHLARIKEPTTKGNPKETDSVTATFENPAGI